MTPALARQTPKPSLLRRLNERAIFDLLLRSGTASRAELMRSLGVTAPTVHKAVASLVEAGFVEEVGINTSRGVGRPGMVYRVASRAVQVIGVAVDVQKTSIVAGRLDCTYDPSLVQHFDTPGTYADLLAEIERRISGLLKPEIQTIGIGISTPGEIDTSRQRVLLSPNLHIIDGQSPSKDLQARLGVDTIMAHDTLGVCLAEWSTGAAKGLKDFVMIGVYEGYGASIVSDGRLTMGRDGMGGELGHVPIHLDGEVCGCGNRGCIETVATDRAFTRRVAQRVGQKMTLDEILDQSRSGKLDVSAELNETLRYLSVGAATAINLFNPEAILVASRLFDFDATALDRLAKQASERALRPLRDQCRFVRAEGDTLRGALASIVHHITGSIGPKM